MSHVEPLIAQLVEQGALCDERFARAWVEQLDRKGISRRAILAKMREKGIEGNLVERELGRIQQEGGDRELLRAIAYARRRRLGPAQMDPERREARRDKDLAAMARAGFGYGLAKRVIQCEDLEALREEAEIGL